MFSFFNYSSQHSHTPSSVVRPQRQTLAKKFNDCKNYDERLNWLQSESGQRAINLRPDVKSLWENGDILLLLNDAEKCRDLEYWLDGYSIPPKKSLQTFDNDGNAIGVELSMESKLQFLTDGYMTYKSLIPPEILKKAIKYVNSILGETNYSCKREGKMISILSDEKCILDLFNQTELIDIANTLLHGHSFGNNSKQREIRGAQIVVRFPTMLEPPDKYELREKNEARDRVEGTSWHIDGMDKNNHSDFNLLIGVALSDQRESFAGNLCVWPGSHHIINKMISDQVHLTGDHDISSLLSDKNRPNLGPPTQLKVDCGDVVIIHQKVAHQPIENLREDIRKMVYFRVSHKEHEILKTKALDNMWIEFESMQDAV